MTSLREFRVEYQTPDGNWWVWRERPTEDEARDDLKSVRTNRTAKAWRLVKITHSNEVIDASGTGTSLLAPTGKVFKGPDPKPIKKPKKGAKS